MTTTGDTTPPAPPARPTQPAPPNPPAPLAGCRSHRCPPGECYCPDGSEPRFCGHGPGGDCPRCRGCYDCDACTCYDD